MIFCFHFNFCLEVTLSEQLDKNDFRHYHDIFFESAILELPDQLCSAMFQLCSKFTSRCSKEKVFWKYASNLQENTHAEVWSQ